MYPHRIRLRGPWQVTPLARLVAVANGPPERQTEALPGARQMTLPCRWRSGGLPHFTGRVRHVRRFGEPRQHTDLERVWLTLAGHEGAADLWLNGEHLGSWPDAQTAVEFDVSARLQPRNELVVELESLSADAGLTGDVALEIRCPAFLRGVLLDWDGEAIVATGTLIGPAERSLELYVLLDGAKIIAQTLTPSPEGTPFRLRSQDLSDEWQTGERWGRVDLVDGPAVWYRVEQSIKR